MALEMKASCEKCNVDLPTISSEAFICSYECTYCRECAERMNQKCPNCEGDLQPRPIRKVKEVSHVKI